jgi:hypothetical protein
MLFVSWPVVGQSQLITHGMLWKIRPKVILGLHSTEMKPTVVEQSFGKWSFVTELQTNAARQMSPVSPSQYTCTTWQSYYHPATLKSPQLLHYPFFNEDEQQSF